MSRVWRVLASGAFVALLVATGAGCSDNGGAAGSETSDPADIGPDDVSKSLPSRLRIAVAGDVAFTYDEAVDLRIVTINRPDVSPVRFLSVGIEDPQSAGGEATFRIAFDLGGAFDGAGTYEIPPVGGSATPSSIDPDADPNAIASGFSRVYLYYWPEGHPTTDAGADAEVLAFENAMTACSVEIDRDDARAGSLTCPAVADSDGEEVSIEMMWEGR